MRQSSDELTVEALAEKTGVIVSTIRMYQQRRLLPPPRRQGRAAFYGPPHVARLRLIDHLRQRGFSLAAIKELLDGATSGLSVDELLGGAGSSVWAAETPVRMTLVELAARLPGVEFDAEMVARTVRMGLVEWNADGTVVVTSPTLLDVGARLAALGVPSAIVLDEYERLTSVTDDIAARFTELFRRFLWEPFVTSGMDEERAAPLVGALDELVPLADSVTAVSLRRSLRDAASAFLAAESRRLAIFIPEPGAAAAEEAS